MSCAFLKGIYFTGTAEILLNMILGKEKNYRSSLLYGDTENYPSG